MSNHDRHLICYFGILNLQGLMGLRHNSVKSENGFTTESDVILPLYSHETYTIKTTFNRNHEFKGFHEGEEHNGSYFAKIHVDENSNPSILKCNGKYYQKFFRKDVLWDFGDGTKVEGYSVEHTYKKPGRYKISCTFFDIDRKAWVNDYSINVIVKEVLPTILRFDKSETKKSINCSKVERIARIEALNSNSVHKNLEVSVERIFTKEQHESNFIEISKKYDKINDERFGFMDKYWTLLENRQTLFYNSNDVHSDYLEPSDTYQPKYNEIFGKFFYNEYDDKMDISLYQVIPYKNIDDNLKTITILDPNFSILEPDHEVYKTYTINQVYTMNQLPSDVVSVGKRGWFDIFYKNDFVGENNTFSLFYDVEKQNITGELESAPNYLNMNPLGFSINVTHNDTSEIRIGYSLDGFLRPLADDDIAKGEYFIDQHLYNTLFMGIDLDTYLFPYIPFGNNEYYIPKDVQILLSYSVNKINGGNNYSYVNHEDTLEQVHPWLYRIPLVLRQYINLKFDVIVGDRTIMMSLVKKRIPIIKQTVVPKELQTKEDIDRLLDVYMAHPMWNDKPNIRAMFKAVLSNGDYLTRILTSSENFLDDTANVKRCFLSNLISTLQMMGEDVTLYEQSSFEGINDLRDFVRLLSMNHTELIGHVLLEDYDIRIRNDIKGKNVGDEIDIASKLIINENGCITKVGTSSVIEPNGVDLIVHDRYTHDTKIVSFSSIYHERNFPTDETVATHFSNPISIGDYEDWWGWNLLLPDSFNTVNQTINELSIKLNNRAISRSTHESIKNEIERLKKVKRGMISGYYSFHLLIPTRNEVRTGNFIDDKYVTSRIESIEDWESTWGIAHEVLMKILIENGYLQNNRKEDYENIGDVINIDVTKFFEKKEISTEITVDGQVETYDVSGSVRIVGDILDKAGNLFKVTLKDGLVANRDAFSMIDGTIECFVDDNGNIENTESVFELTGNRVNGVLTLVLGGTVKNPNFVISAKLNYAPPITKKTIDNVIDLVSPVYLDDVIQCDTEFRGKIRISGDIVGIGDNTLVVEFLEGSVYYNGEIKLDDNGKPYDNIILEYDEMETEGQQNLLNIVVSEDGQIYQKIESYKIINDPNRNLYKENWKPASRSVSVLPDSMMYGYRTALGEIRLVIEGEVQDIKVTATSSLFMKSPDFIVLPEGTPEAPSTITVYESKLDNFNLYSTYERRHNRKYKELASHITNMKLDLYSPRYDYNLGKCWMDGTCSFDIFFPQIKSKVDEKTHEDDFDYIWTQGYYPKSYYGSDSDVSANRYDNWTSSAHVEFTDTFEFDTVIGDMVEISKTFDLYLAEYTDNIVEGKITVTIDGCIDDKIGVRPTTPVRDIRITVDELDDVKLRGVYAALYDIDDTYTLDYKGKDKDCKSLQPLGIKTVKVKNNGRYPMLNKIGSYNRNDTVTIDIDFDDKSSLHTSSTETFSLKSITLDKDANLKHGNMIFNVYKDIKTSQFNGDEYDVDEYMDGTITIGLVDSQYKIIDVSLVYHTGWEIICSSEDFNYVTTFSGVRGCAVLKSNKKAVSPDRKFNLIVDFMESEKSNNGLSFNSFNIGGTRWHPNWGCDSIIIENCSIDEDGNVKFDGVRGTYAREQVTIWDDNQVQYTQYTFDTTIRHTKTLGSLEENDGKVYFDVDVDILFSESYKTQSYTQEYKWTLSVEDKEEKEEKQPLSFTDSLIKTYDPDSLPNEGKQLSINGDMPLIPDSSIPGGSGIKIDEIETGGIKLTTEAILQYKTASFSVEEVPTAVDAWITTDNNNDGKWQRGDEVTPVELTTEFLFEVEGKDGATEEVEGGVNCQIDYDGNLSNIPINSITVKGTGERRINIPGVPLDDPNYCGYKYEEYYYEMAGKFTINYNGYNIFEPEDSIMCYNLGFTKTRKEEEDSGAWIEYSDDIYSTVVATNLKSLEDGYSMFYGHVVDYEDDYKPALSGSYSRLSSWASGTDDTGGTPYNAGVASVYEITPINDETTNEEDEESVSSRKYTTFYKQFNNLTTTTDMFSGCLLNEYQVANIIEGLYYNKIGGEIALGIDGDVENSKHLNDVIPTIIGSQFNINGITVTTEPNLSDPTYVPPVWKVSFTKN